MTPLGRKFEEALRYTHELHRDQKRKETDIPYISHLLSVCALVLEHGGSETQAIAALLHDGPEDQGGEATLAEIQKRFGAGVAAIVSACSDTMEVPKPPWRARKESYIAHLESVPKEVLLVSMADKLHNARAILADYRVIGEALWQRFSGGRDGTLWYYRALVTAYRRLEDGPLLHELDRTVGELEALAR